MQNIPLVSIVILTYNRIDVLIEVINKLNTLTYKNKELILVNNNSTDNTKEKIEELFPEILLINLDSNIGISALNYGLKLAKGKYILQLDDDSYPEADLIEKAITEFENNNNLGYIAFKVINLRYNLCETNEFPEFPKLFNGCGVMFNAEVFNKSGYYNNNIFIYYNEIDLAIRMIDKGYKTLYKQDLIVYHLQSTAARENKNSNPFISEFRFYNHFISYFIFLYSNFNKRFVLKFTIKLIISNLITAVFYKYYKEYLRGIIKCIKVVFNKNIKSNPVSLQTQALYEYGNFPLIDRLFFPNFNKPKIFKWLKLK